MHAPPRPGRPQVWRSSAPTTGDTSSRSLHLRPLLGVCELGAHPPGSLPGCGSPITGGGAGTAEQLVVSPPTARQPVGGGAELGESLGDPWPPAACDPHRLWLWPRPVTPACQSPEGTQRPLSAGCRSQLISAPEAGWATTPSQQFCSEAPDLDGVPGQASTAAASRAGSWAETPVSRAGWAGFHPPSRWAEMLPRGQRHC